ncbi:MAG: GNAT family N-acetyltransferase [Thermoplasmata archaeon]
MAGHPEDDIDIVQVGKEQLHEVIDVWNRSGLKTKPGGRDCLTELEKQVEQKNVFFLAALEKKEGRKPVGVVLVTHDSRKGWINRLAVLPEYRKKGYASALIKAAEELLEKNGIYVWCALIEEWNKASISLFLKNSYTEHKDIIYFTKRKSKDV